jgi:hypothetical protein
MGNDEECWFVNAPPTPSQKPLWHLGNAGISASRTLLFGHAIVYADEPEEKRNGWNTGPTCSAEQKRSKREAKEKQKRSKREGPAPRLLLRDQIAERNKPGWE